jgi:hypothetical protein
MALSGVFCSLRRHRTQGYLVLAACDTKLAFLSHLSALVHLSQLRCRLISTGPKGPPYRTPMLPYLAPCHVRIMTLCACAREVLCLKRYCGCPRQVGTYMQQGGGVEIPCRQMREPCFFPGRPSDFNFRYECIYFIERLQRKQASRRLRILLC